MKKFKKEKKDNKPATAWHFPHRKRGCARVLYQDLARLLGLERDSILRIVDDPSCEQLKIYHNDDENGEWLCWEIAEGQAVPEQTLKRLSSETNPQNEENTA